ncbi:DUF262 domain-containing protein [Facklamia sp. 7083-14-GEN3]|uniref:DUF262 domain-containing protein n=1 Tax=Facklamia sp. 7083-14-GEN3 TaxID=2973478 RepID=UPI00215B7DCB|nr:DUF262 domain-containing HNH endonuclease family protein [Facklamia sp. 7083-14-GEN3]MCR8969085.1 DUF262 domain-containing HNH endonuclease family protein [Facklamia sp. 7083-14-GEN3]
MNFESDRIKIKDLLSNGREYIIPRYQREYSWEDSQLEDFYNDIIDNIGLDEDEQYINTDYFFGTIIIIGDMTSYKEPLEIIDGQQRITTFTIALSVLADLSYKKNKNISDNIWKYVIGSNDDGEEYAVLKNDTANPYFQLKIQNRIDDSEEYKIIQKEIQEIECASLTPEERSIKNAYDFFYEKFSNENLCKKFPKLDANDHISKIRLIRDQILENQLIYISSRNQEYVNTIFENINSKGLQLSAIDLIKNEIFSVEKDIVPRDDAKAYWEKLINNLNRDGKYIHTATFFRQFWNSKYKHSTEKELYNNFLEKIEVKDYFGFLKKLDNSSKNYYDIMFPREDLFKESPKGNGISKKDAESLILSINSINQLFNVTQSQIVMLVIYEKYLEDKIKFKQLRKFAKFLEEFHFVYNAVSKLPTNTLESKYGKYARRIDLLDDRESINQSIEDFKSEMKDLYPDRETFLDRFKNFEYVKKTSKKTTRRSNLVSKYIVRKYEEISSEGNPYDIINSSVEHIIPETDEDYTKSIGNLVLLEENINNQVAQLDFKQKLSKYKESNYKSVKKFVDQYKNDFTKTDVEERTLALGNELYDHIVNR